ncbi:MAG: hypothetical protein U0974_11215 [Gemmatimonadales bacterium]|nr:hypothetical protein [Gemmatimonadales bacterium]MDZ4390282.1 hypothetical protein [Gemmatimonadales bacterium]
MSKAAGFGKVTALIVTATALVVALGIPEVTGGQSRQNLYQCEGCEAIHERSFDGLSWLDTIANLTEPGDRLVLTGSVVLPDGKTPAAGVIIYAYHTNAAGLYPKRGDEQGWGRRHGYLRGWARTNAAGEYRFETIRPGTYPDRAGPAHIHLTVKEPERQEYWLDDVVFTDDMLVTPEYRRNREGRGGSGIVTPVRDSTGTWTVRRNIVLEP